MAATCTVMNAAQSIPRTMLPERRFWNGIQRVPPLRGIEWISRPYHLDQARRDAVLEAIQEVCGHRGWGLLAAHVRSNHVHTVVEAEVPPERVLSDFKAYASRRLNRMRLDQPNRKRWARHGSTRWLWNRSMSRRQCSTSLPSRVMP